MESRFTLAARVGEIAPFHVMEVQTAARALEAAGRSVVHMEIGEPDFPTPGPVLDAARRALVDGGIYYTSALGLPELRAAIAQHYARSYGVTIAPERIIVTAGSSAALLLVMALVVGRDDRILLADPGYPCNRHFIRVLEGEPVGIATGPESRYQLIGRGDRARVDGPDARRADRVAVEPDRHRRSRPTRWGASRPRSRDAGGHLVVDEIYLGLTYDGEPRSALATTGALADDLFVVSSFSKYFNMTGWRLGWIVAPERHVRDLEKLAQNLYISPPTLSQRAALACFRPETLAIARGTAAGVPGAARFPRARAARAGLRHSGHADRRVLRLRRQLALRRGLAGDSAATYSKARASRSRPASTSARIAPSRTCASPTRSRWRSSRTASRGLRGSSRSDPVAAHGMSVTASLRRGNCRRARGGDRVAGCSAIEFYWQGLAGQLDLLARARPIPEVAEATSDPVLKAKLERAQEMRTFASHELALPDNASYTRYADLGRPYVVWNVFAAPELSLAPRQWCFPIAGCVAYRGYFAEEGARAEAARLVGRGLRRPRQPACRRTRRSAISTTRCCRRSSAAATPRSRA